MDEIEGERRKNRRLEVKAGVFCRKIDSQQPCFFDGSIVNISPCGLLAEVQPTTAMNIGDLCNIDMDIPDGEGASQFEGRVSAYGRVMRIVELQPNSKPKKHIAFKFCVRPQFDI